MRREMAASRTLIYLVALTLLPSISSLEKNEVYYHSTDNILLRLGDVEHCSISSTNWTTYNCDPRPNGYCKVGDSVNAACNVGNPDLKGFTVVNDGDLMIYPNSTIRCRSDGTWSGPMPICVVDASKGSNVTVSLEPIDCTKSSNIKCPQDLTGWVAVKPVNCTGIPPNDETDLTKKQSYRVLVTLPQHYYSGFIIVFPPFKVNEVRILIEKNSELSAKALEFPEYFYDNWNKSNPQISITASCYCSIALAAYIEKFIIEFSTNGEPLNQPTDISSGTLFYPVQEGKPITNKDEKPSGCSEPPIIPYARNFRDGVKPYTFAYVCPVGYVMYDPFNNSMSDGELSCSEGKWIPYPHPVCRLLEPLNPTDTVAGCAMLTANGVVVFVITSVVVGLVSLVSSEA